MGNKKIAFSGHFCMESLLKGDDFMTFNQTPRQRREQLRQDELKKNPTGNVNDAFNRSNNGSLVDLIGGLGWKGTGVLILVMVFGFVIYYGIFQ